MFLNGRAQLPLAWNRPQPDNWPMFDLESSLRDLGHQYELETRRIRVAVRPA